MRCRFRSLNLEVDEGEEKVRANYSAEKYAKLAALMATWDPDNLFHLNQTIKPAAQTTE